MIMPRKLEIYRKKFLGIFFIIFAFLITNSLGNEYKLGNLKINHPYIMETPKGAVTAAGYMEIVNKGDQTDYLSIIKVNFAKTAEIHETKMENDMIKMQKVEGGLEISAHGSVKLKHGTYHIMFMKLSKPMIKGETHEGILYFEKAGNIKITFSVEKMGH